MLSKMLYYLLLSGLLIGLVSPVLGLEKVMLGTAVKMHAPFYLPILAAEEKGFWKDNGLDVEWVPFVGGTALMHGIAAGSIKTGFAGNATPMSAGERGLSVLAVAELAAKDPYLIWVKTDSPYRHIRDLAGKRVAVTTLGAALHVFGRIIFAAHGIEKEVRFVAAGGIPQQMAGIKVGAFEAMVNPLSVVVGMKVEGIVRELASADDYLPKPWYEQVVFVQRDFARGKPDLVRKVVKGTLQSSDFIRKNPRWAVDKIKDFQGISQEGAKLVYEGVQFTATGKLDRRAVENVRKVFVDYGIITERAPAVDDLFTNEYLP